MRFSIFCFLFFAIIPVSVFSQTATNSPYSRYGLGDINSAAFSFGQAMGGISAGLQNDTLAPFNINAANPASYSTLKLTTFDAGIGSTSLNLKSQSGNYATNSAYLNYIALGIPVKKWWGMSVGLTPFSSVGYEVTDSKKVSNTADVTYKYAGDGGLNRVYMGHALKFFSRSVERLKKSQYYQQLLLAKNEKVLERALRRHQNISSFSLGFNVSYLFGTINSTRRVIFPGLYFADNTRITASTEISDVYFDLGMQQNFYFKNDLKLTIGISGGLTSQLNARGNLLSVTYVPYSSSNGVDNVKDTIDYQNNVKGTVTMPLSFTGGFVLSKGDKWLIGADYALQNWSEFKFLNKASELTNSNRIAIGGQYLPNITSDHFLNRIGYRAGLRYSNTPLLLRNTQLQEYAVSAGLGIPVGVRNRFFYYATIHVGVEVGMRGTTANGLIQEQFTRLFLGVTFSDRWFIKPKID